MTFHPFTFVKTTRDGVVSRRRFLRRIAAGTAGLAGVGALGGFGWRDAVTAHAGELRRRGMAVILLWMPGGPSQFETFDPKPGTDAGGPTAAIATAVPGVRIAAGWEQTAKVMGDLSVIRSMTHKEGEHERAAYQLHTGYAPTPAVKHPAFGSIVSAEIAPDDFDLPHFVRIGDGGTDVGPGFLGNAAAPFNVESPLAMPRNVVLPAGVGGARFARRLDLAKDLGAEFADEGAAALVAEHDKLYGRAARLVRSKDLAAFDLSPENEALRDRYGRNPFGQGCLLARRLVERGVTFVEVVSGHPEAPAAWDTHIDNFAVTSKLVSRVDPATASLITDLKERGLLETTLVIWMGEFGRTPKINDRGATGGRDHYPKAFSVALAGCGVRGGRVVGATDAAGVEVADRPVTVPDLFCTFCHALKINPRKKNYAPGDVPVKLVDGGEPVKELFG